MFSKMIETCVEGFPQAVIIISLLIVSLEHKNIRGWIVSTLDTQLLPYTVIFAMLIIKTIFGYVMTVSTIRYLQFTHYKYFVRLSYFKKLFPRNYKRFPRSPGTLGLFLQWMAILSLLFPKFLMVGTSMKPAPYFFGVIFLLEYILIIIYNKLVYGIFAGKF